MAVPKKKKSYTKCNKRYTAWRNNNNVLVTYSICNFCFNANRHSSGLYLKTNTECLFCLKKTKNS